MPGKVSVAPGSRCLRLPREAAEKKSSGGPPELQFRNLEPSY
jgi:hypothetical protein